MIIYKSKTIVLFIKVKATARRKERNMKKYVLFDLDGTLTDPMVGITTCVQYALAAAGKLKQGDIARIISLRDRSLAGDTAPAHGLYLNKVFYPSGFPF